MRHLQLLTMILLAGSLWLAVAGCKKSAEEATAPPAKESQAAAEAPAEVAVAKTAPAATAVEPPPAPEAPPPPVEATVASVKGTIEGQAVDLIHAEYSQQLALFEGDGWGFSPSILIFLFLDKDELPDGKTYTFEADKRAPIQPHLHCRYPNGDDRKDLGVKIYSGKYDLTLTFGQRADGKLPGTIDFTVPETGTSVKGAFVATVK